MDLYLKSIEVILANQASGGAYVASPSFATYHYCWFRDGSFIAHSMDLVGEHGSAKAFHDWVAETILARRGQIELTVAKVRAGEVVDRSDYLHARYDPEGEESDESTEWPNHQLDGFGTWIWALEQHIAVTGEVPDPSWIEAAGLLASYVGALFNLPCYDCWEEFPEEVHTYTLAAIHAGLRAHMSLTGADHTGVLDQISSRIESAGSNGFYVKHSGTEAVDANLIGLAVPYRVADLESDRMAATIEEIERALREGGGLKRYPTDTYYGGGEWVLLTCWLAWYYLEVGEVERAGTLLRWVEAQKSEEGWLPEQVPHALNFAEHYQPWVDKWGEIANPLLWSHAMYLICIHKMGAA